MSTALRHVRNGTAPGMRLRSHHVLRRAHTRLPDAGPVLRLQDSAPNRVFVQPAVLGLQERRFGTTQRIFSHAQYGYVYVLRVYMKWDADTR